MSNDGFNRDFRYHRYVSEVTKIEELEAELKAEREKNEELQDFCIWLTGCGYDFTQHEYFIKKRDELLKESSE